MRTALEKIGSWNLNADKWLPENRHGPWKTSLLELISDYWEKQKWGTYSKSQGMKRFITDAIISEQGFEQVYHVSLRI